ncbi:hypothetical protein QYS48_11280 [Marivirga arenosa]|uniref:Uncharacterized protein n=1 Tax=Marivirga arenosa TaxID=3059076 RepID=A0AA49JDV7_9BACT|nr:hypothetical protein [Marivirga sp. ABR2-2]WKK87303.1 hypothetical protein QYS48_11280 [Marivirga sp. ABR2-2]
MSRLFILLLFFQFFGCRTIDEFDPFQNKLEKGISTYSMNYIGLNDGSDFGKCFLASDLARLYESASGKEIVNVSFEIYIDGQFFTGSSISNYSINCIVDLSQFANGRHDVSILITPHDDYQDDDENSLASFFGYIDGTFHFQQSLNFVEENLGDIHINDARLINGNINIEYETKGGANPSVFEISNIFGSSVKKKYLFKRGKSLEFTWGTETDQLLLLTYSNRFETKSTTIFLR